ncbi:hypothetical protein C8A00DRAFT_33418 [Chaetomidium leptoderma]|uniref:Uncharacterized protein n=1 Tax=Chaetomidium leptoderma TaxID=669021 RepID=A0AAN6VM38_9PEZI|nr:hypothetical protein C8A00DRAFT_33418 [Chaetomidium leptoderma]
MSGEIEQWQRSVLNNGTSGPSSSKTEGLASRLGTTASELFRLALNHGQLRAPKSAYSKLQREYGYLQLWCDGYGVVAGDLDLILAESKRLRHSTVRLLVNICHILADKLTIVLLPGLDETSQHALKEKAARARDLVEVATFAMHRTDDSDSDSDSSSICGDYSVEDIVEDLRTDIQCLVDLGPRYKEPIQDKTVVEEAAVPPSATTWDPAEYLASRIRHRYPNGDASFAQILGQTNWDRAQRLYALKETRDREAQQPAARLGSARPSKTAVASDFYDSGLGASVGTTSSYAETVLSYHGAKGGSIKIPQVPVEGLQGQPFSCDICGLRCQLPDFNWKSYWKKHVLFDLQPYVCVIASCSFSNVPFSNKKAWVHHLELEHNFADPAHEMTCPLCQEHIISGKASHLARHLEEISLTILPANAEDDEASDGSLGQESDEEAGHVGSLSPKPDAAGEHAPDLPPPSYNAGGVPGWSLDENSEWAEAIVLLDFENKNNHELRVTKGQLVWVLKPNDELPSKVWVLAISRETGGKGVVPRSNVALLGSTTTRLSQIWLRPKERTSIDDMDAPTPLGESAPAQGSRGEKPLEPASRAREKAQGSSVNAVASVDESGTASASWPADDLAPKHMQSPEWSSNLLTSDDLQDFSLFRSHEQNKEDLLWNDMRSEIKSTFAERRPDLGFFPSHSQDPHDPFRNAMQSPEGPSTFHFPTDPQDFVLFPSNGQDKDDFTLHTTAAGRLKCPFEPCPYQSTRSSNLKQHVLKAHGSDATETPIEQETTEEEQYKIKCLCHSADDDGNTIYCETCKTWQHIKCYYPANGEEALQPEFIHSCVNCRPVNIVNRVDQERNREEDSDGADTARGESGKLSRDGDSQPGTQEVAKDTFSENPAVPIPGGPMETLNGIAGEFNGSLLPLCLEFAARPPKDVEERVMEHRKLSELILQKILLKLDAVDTSTEAGARMRRKELVAEVQKVLTKLDVALRGLE